MSSTPPSVVGATEVVASHRPGPRRRALVREQAHLQRRHVAVADPARALGHAARDALPVDRIEQPRHAVAAAARHRDRRRRVGHAVQRGQPLFVAAGKTLVAQLDAGIELDAESQCLQPRGGTPQGLAAQLDAGSRVHLDQRGLHRVAAARRAAAIRSPRRWECGGIVVAAADRSRSARSCARRSLKNSRSSAACRFGQHTTEQFACDG